MEPGTGNVEGGLWQVAGAARDGAWKGHGESRAVAKAFAAGLDGAAVGLNQVADNREPEAEAAVLPRRRLVRLPERLEHVGKEARIDARAVVGHRNRHEITEAMR